MKMTQQAKTFYEGGNEPTAGTTSETLYRVLMGGTNTGVGGNNMGGTKGIVAAPPAEIAAGNQNFEGRGSTGCSVLTEAAKMFWPTAKM